MKERSLPTISVVMYTYNGADHLCAQLKSLSAQDMRPFELVVYDDGSQDASPFLLAAYARQAPFPVILKRNRDRQGRTPHFQKVIQGCRGDIIVFCDQGNVCLSHQLATLAAPFMEDANLDLVISDAHLVDHQGNPLGRTLWQQLRFDACRRHAFERDPFSVMLRSSPALGASMAFKRSSLQKYLPIPDAWSHHFWPALMLALEGRIVLRDKCLILYRQHRGRGRLLRLSNPDSVTGQKVHRYGQHINRYRSLLQELARRRDVPPWATAFIRESIHHYNVRARLPQGLGRMAHTLPELLTGRYHRHSQGWRAWAKDLLIKS